MNNTRETVGVAGHVQKNKTPFTSGMVNRAKSKKTKAHYTLVRRAFLAIVLSHVYQSVIAGAATAGIVLLGGHHGF
jgi:hypothetical protein